MNLWRDNDDLQDESLIPSTPCIVKSTSHRNGPQARNGRATCLLLRPRFYKGLFQHISHITPPWCPSGRCVHIKDYANDLEGIVNVEGEFFLTMFHGILG